jgi:hypothetical protein
LVVELGQLTGVYKNMTRGIVALVFRAHAIGGTARARQSRRLFVLAGGQAKMFEDSAVFAGVVA